MENIVLLKNINDLPKKILQVLNSSDNLNKQLLISFDNNFSESINIFLSKNKQIKDIYFVDKNYQIKIDLLEYNIQMFIWFVDCVEFAYKIIISKSNVYIDLFDDELNVWNISVCNNIMFNFPFTLGTNIFIPLSYISQCYHLNKKKKIIETLIHEKIHIGQRYKENLWEKFIEKNSKNWKKINLKTIDFEFINVNIMNSPNKNFIFISNPDTFYQNFKYIYVDADKKKYYGQYIQNNKTKKIEKKYFQFDPVSNVFIETKKNLLQEHPYEIYAYEISNRLISINSSNLF